MTDVDLGAILDRLLRAAREITGARYAAVGVLNDQGTELAQFLPAGLPEEIQQNIGEMPRGRGVLGAPIVIRGQAWGNLYLAEKQGSEFSEQDEEAAIMLADSAAVAIDNARRYEATVHRREEVEKALRGLEATHDVTVTIGGEIAFEHMLELIVKRGRALVGARSLVIMLRKGHERGGGERRPRPGDAGGETADFRVDRRAGARAASSRAHHRHHHRPARPA